MNPSYEDRIEALAELLRQAKAEANELADSTWGLVAYDDHDKFHTALCEAVDRLDNAQEAADLAVKFIRLRDEVAA